MFKRMIQRVAVLMMVAFALGACATKGEVKQLRADVGAIQAGHVQLAQGLTALSAQKADAKDVSVIAGIVAAKADKAEAAKLREEIAAMAAGKADKAPVETALATMASKADVRRVEAAAQTADKKVGNLAKRVATAESRTAQLGASRASSYIREIQTKFGVPDGSKLIHFWGFPSGGSDFEALASKSAKIRVAAAALKEDVKGGATILGIIGFEDMSVCPKGAGENCLKVAERRAQSAAKYFDLGDASKIKSMAPTADFGWSSAESRRVIVILKPAPLAAAKAPAPAVPAAPATPPAVAPVAPPGSKS